MNRPLSEFIQREVKQGAVNAHWAMAKERLYGRPSRRWVPRVAFSAVAVALLTVGGWWAFARAPRLSVGGAFVASAPTSLQLTDGSKLELGQGATVVLGVDDLDRVELSLITGSATFDVSKNPNRKFVVLASDVAVEVVGTRFTVNRDRQGLVRVEVERGVVNVFAHGRVRRLTAGEQWSPLARELEVELEAPVPATPPDAGLEAPIPSDEPIAEAPVPADPPARKKKLRGPAKRVPVQSEIEASAADTLFAQALAARSTRRWQRAAALAERFLTENPTDPRAGLMAFELGRVLADQLGRREAAMQAYARAMQLDPQADFIDDLLVRWAEAAYANHDLATCVQRRDEYLRRFPRGQLRATVRGICG